MASTASKLSLPLSGSHAFHIFCDRHIFPILLHNVVTLTAIQYYVFDDWHQRRDFDKRTHQCASRHTRRALMASRPAELPTYDWRFDNVKRSFFATGQHRDMTVQETILQGAIRNAANGKSAAPSVCVWIMAHPEWVVEPLKLGSVSSFNEDAYCGASLPFHICISGGNDHI
ncbi:hypothetical protein KXV75_004240 [Aspergillus fumigatus]|nr:hypothetical protein KXV75_004240 [Aspergillus fumigatus]